MKTKPVQGPYNILPLEGKYYGTRLQLGNGAIVNIWVDDEYKTASIREQVKPGGWSHEDNGFDHIEQPRDLGTARLFAAAPELYAACYAILNDGFEEALILARDAIRKVDQGNEE